MSSGKNLCMLFAILTITWFGLSVPAESLASDIERRIPERPPPPLPPCPPIPPNYAETPPECMTFEELRDQYLKLEGHANRRTMFYHVFSRFADVYIGRPRSNIDLNHLIEILGDPDLKKIKIDDDGVPIEEYAYRFDYKSEKDWVCIATTKNGIMIAAGYTEYGDRFKIGWEEY